MTAWPWMRRSELVQPCRPTGTPTSKPICALITAPLGARSIAAAAHRLAERLATRCPTCTTPGWGIVRVELGVPCQLCRRRVPVPNADVYGCAACTFEQAVSRPESNGADPGRCQWCNP